jgi:hypothetical protein
MKDQPVNICSDLPPLRIHHFLGWMAVAGLFFGISGVGAPRPVTLLTLSIVPGMLGSTMAATACLFGLWWRRRGIAFPRDPGHWICVVIAVAFPLMVLHQLAYSLCLDVSDPAAIRFREPVVLTEWFEQWGFAVVYVPIIALNLWIAKRFAGTPRWMWFFLSGAVFGAIYVFNFHVSALLLYLLSPLGSFAFPLHQAARFLTDAHQILPALILCSACWLDHRDGIQRHWSHWCGVMAILVVLPGVIAIACFNMGWRPAPWG